MSSLLKFLGVMFQIVATLVAVILAVTFQIVPKEATPELVRSIYMLMAMFFSGTILREL